MERRVGGALHWRSGGLFEKPPYQQLMMADVRAAEKRNGLTLVSTFSGCGGSSMGYRLAGYDVRWASEFIPAARETYLANFPTTPVDGRDIREVDPQRDILDVIGLKRGELDVLEGSPPCASFSMSGRREAGWGKVRKYSDSKQRVDDLFFEFVRILTGLQPRAFTAENVAGLDRGAAKKMLEQFHASFIAAGYKTEYRLLDASLYGVPQNRVRLIFMGIRNDLKRLPAWPEETPYRYGVEDVLPWFGPGKNEPCPLQMEAEDVGNPLAAGYETTKEAEKILPGEQSDRYFSLTRLRLHGPAQTVLAAHGAGKESVAGLCAPHGDRKLHIPEIRRICGFPDDFKVTGTYAQRWERYGRAVPPRFMEAIARKVAEIIGGPHA